MRAAQGGEVGEWKGGGAYFLEEMLTLVQGEWCGSAPWWGVLTVP